VTVLSTGPIAAGYYMVNATGVAEGGAAKAYWTCQIGFDGGVEQFTRVTVAPTAAFGEDQFAPFAITTAVHDFDGNPITLDCGWSSSLIGDTGPNTVDYLSLTLTRVDTVEVHNVAFP
jgi:hypothetical protein